MSVLPTPYTVLVREPTAGAEDEFGNIVKGWTDPRPWAVHALAPGGSAEPEQSNRDLSLVVWSVLGPKTEGCPGTAGAQVRLPGGGEWFDVDGHPDDWTNGPWDNPAAGLVVNLRRADG